MKNYKETKTKNKQKAQKTMRFQMKIVFLIEKPSLEIE